MILTGDPVESGEALAIGLVDAVDEDPLAGAAALLDRVLRNGPLAVRNALLAVDAGLSGIEDGLTLEASLFASLAGSGDMREGLGAFLEKRPPQFRGA